MSRRADDAVDMSAEWDATDQFPFRHVERCSKPWVARINGLCHAGGIDLVLHCDVTIASDRARFRVPELLRGIPDPFMSSRLAAAVGLARARYLFFTAADLSAAEAEAMGLVNRVVPQAELETYVTDYARRIADNAPLTVTSIKRIVGEALKDPAERDLAAVEAMVKACFASEDYKEGRRAFMEKRKPRFTGR
jgi:enoyl-CoA hydratase/carnithine racemase